MRILFTVCFLVISLTGFSADFTATQNGNWNIGTTWGGACTTGCVEGTDYPGINDNAYTNSFVVTVNGNFSCHNLFVEYNVANGISFSNGAARLSISGSLAVWDTGAAFYADPTADVISNVGTLRFTAANVDLISPYVILLWDNTVADFCALSFDFGAAGAGSLMETINVGSARSLQVTTGTLTADPGVEILGLTNSTLTVAANAFLETDDPIRAGTVSTGFATVTVNGTLTTSSYVNATNFTMGAAGILHTTFNGSNQTEGWWYQSARPTGGTMNAGATVSFEAGANQNVYTRTYGNLILDGTGTKTLAGGGTLNVSGSLTINSASTTLSSGSSAINIGTNLTNNGTFSPGALVTFNGTGAQQIGGTSTTSFGSGLTVNKSAGTLTLAQNISVSAGLTISAGMFDLATHTLTITNNNITNNGTFTPSSSTVIISGTTSVGGSSTTSFNNLTINGIFTSPSTLNIAGDLTNNGTFNANSGTLVFNGTTDQSIAGTLTVNNINITNTTATNGILVNGNVNLDGTLTLVNSASKFDADGSGSGVLTVRSTSVNAGGRIAQLPSPSNFTGSVTVQRFIDGPDTWRYLAMPITNGNVSMWKDDFPVTGNFSDPSPAGVNGVVNSSSASIYSFNPTTNGYVAIGSGGSTASTSLSNTVGYSAYSYLTGDFTISVRGTIGKNNVSIPISTANGGYNLIPNPYPSAIDWDNVTKTGLNDAMWIRTANNQFASYVSGVATNPPFGGWTGEVAMGQAYWIQSTSASNLTMKEADKTSNQYEFLREVAPRDYMRVTLLSANQRDEAVIRFKDDAIETFDAQYDARKRKNGDFSNALQRYTHLNISSYTTSATDDYAINSIPVLQCAAKNIKLKVEDVATGNYTLRFGDLDKMDVAYGIVLIDHFLNKETVIEEGAEYNFAVTADALSKGTSRFELKFNPVAVDLQRELPLTAVQQCADPLVKLEVANSQPGVAYVFKLNNADLHTAITGNGQKITVSVNRSSLATGLNKLSLVASSAGGCDAHTFNDALNVTIDPVVEVSTVTAGEHCGGGSVTLTAAGAPLGGTYRWYETATATEPLPGANQSTFTTPVLEQSKTYFVTAVNVSGCESGQRQAVEAKINTVHEVTAVTAAQSCGEGSVTLSASGAPKGGSYRWYEALTGGTAIPAANEAAFTTPVLSGSKTYFVSVVNSSGCESANRLPVEAKIVNASKPEVVVTGNVLSVSQDAVVQW